MNEFFVGQQLKNSPSDDFPYFEIVNITTLETTGTVFYRVKCIHDHDSELVLHEEDLFPFETETENINVINEDVKSFEEGKSYIFSPDKIEVKEVHRWINHIVNPFVKVKLSGLGFITVNHPRYGLKEFPIYPKFCLEVQ